MLMNNKQHILTLLREEFNRWEALLASLNEEQITVRQLPANLSIKDVIAHLRAWQQVSIARLEAALLNREPEFPESPAEFDLDTENNVDGINAWIYETYRDRPWSSVYHDWKEGFLRFLELGEVIPETDLLDAGRYPWMRGYSLAASLLGSYEHHHDDHLEPLLAWLRQHGNMKIAG
jgi:hypothetical protein